MGRRHILVGGGPATVAAAAAIRAVDAAADVTVVAADANGYYSRPGLAYYLSGELPAARLFPFTNEDMRTLRAEWIQDTAVTLDLAARTVTLLSGRVLPYDRLLLATGSLAVEPKVPGAGLDGVVKLDGMDDARDIVRRCRKDATALVVGGGITALEIAEGLRARGVQVHYLLRKGRYWGDVLSEEESQLVQQRLEREGVHVHRFSELAAILGRDGRVAGVETDDGERLACDLVAVAVGVRPAVDLARHAGLACERGVLVDGCLQTSDENVWAAGDIAETETGPTGRRVLEVLWNAALAKGRVAGLNMAAEAGHVYDPGVPLNITRLGGLRTTIIGTVGTGSDPDLQALQRGDSQVWAEPSEGGAVEQWCGDAHLRLTLGRSVMAGAVVMGGQELSFPLQELIESRVDVSGALVELRAPGAPVERLITKLWQEWRANVV
jgi:NAD(P)H-nitrite reductase large subunit